MSKVLKGLGRYSWLVLIWSILFLPQADAEAELWNTKKSKHFVIHYQEDAPEYLNQLIRKAEYYYNSIADYLGFKRFDFWLWDNRCKIYLYPNQKEYLSQTGRHSWSRAHVNVIKKEIKTYVWQDGFFDTILPHEMGHIIFREFIGYKKNLPLWLDEGVACMQEANSQDRLLTAKALVGERLFIPLNVLSNIRDYNFVTPVVFYSQSASLVDFILSRFGRSRFVDFCRRLRDEDSWEASLKSEYKFEDLEELERLWIADLTE